ncbi:MAG: hypothetical protein M3160_05610 [Candidatus Eremiobacteraeota bacterium]|nr:hypothetical protein [Candidatus Eremiobacteraeota bacterium]
MKFGNLDPATAEIVALPWLLSTLEPVSEYGRLQAQSATTFAFGEEAQALEEIRRVAHLGAAMSAQHVDVLRSCLRGVGDATGAIASLGVADVVTDTQFFEVLSFCDAVEKVRAQTTVPGFPPLPPVQEALLILDAGRTENGGFYLDDRFDAALLRSRMRLEETQAKFDVARSRVAERVARVIEREEIPTGEFILMREAVSQPLPAEIHVVREAPTYYLCELELDEDALASLEERDASVVALAAAEQFVRSRLCATLRLHAPALARAAHILGDIDLLLAKVRFAQQHPGCIPQLGNTAAVEFREGRFLPLLLELQREGAAYVPISLHLKGVAVLSGPNMGGKSVALKTCAFLVLCASLGLPVPAASAKLVLFQEICWLGIGVEEHPAGLLSAFAREVVRLRDLLARNAEPALILIDEFARTTNPREGRALLLAVIAALRRRNVCTLVATHLAGIAESAAVPHFAVRGLRGLDAGKSPQSLADALALLAASMDYTITEVAEDSAPSADAIALAEILGLDHELIAAARRAL